MRQLPQEIQFCLDTWEPDQTGTYFFLGGAQESEIYLIPVKPTLRHWLANQYNLNIRGLGLINNPGDPLPTGRLQIAIYRSTRPVSPVSTNMVVGNMVKGTLYSVNIAMGPPFILNLANFTQALAIGGSYFIVIKFDDTTPSGINVFQFIYTGWTVANANLTHAIFHDTTIAVGNLPDPLVCTPVPVSNFPWVRADYV